MVQTLIAYDYSGSTHGNGKYHQKTQEIVKEYPDATILLWDDKAKTTTKNNLKRINVAQIGNGGTDPSVVAKYIKDNNFHENLVIITDGQVMQNDVNKCDKILHQDREPWKFNNVECFVIDSFSSNPNMSVTCPFTRVSPHEVTLIGRVEEFTQTLSQEDLDILAGIDTIDTIDKFNETYESLNKAIVARTMGVANATQLKNKLLVLKAKLIRDESISESKKDFVTNLTNNLTLGNFDEALSDAYELSKQHYSKECGWSANMSRLISMCDGALVGVFSTSGICSKLGRANTVTETKIPLVESDTTPKNFECPITLDSEGSVIVLVNNLPAILEGVDKNTVNDVIDCPLNIFKYKDLVEAFKNRIDHPISLVSYRESLESETPIETSPMTRNIIIGGICLGTTKEHVDSTKWIFAQIVFPVNNGYAKLVGNPDLWYAVFMIIARKMNHLEDILPQVHSQMQYRLANNMTYISLTGLPEFPTYRVPLGVAIWYIFHSAYHKISEGVLRKHLYHIDELLELNKLTPFILKPEIGQYIDKLKFLLSMLSWVKKDPRRLPNVALALVRNTIRVPGYYEPPSQWVSRRYDEFIPIDGPPNVENVKVANNLIIEKCFGVNTSIDSDTLYYLSTLVNASLSAKDITLPIDFVVPKFEFKDIWKPIPNSIPVRICKATCRPFYQFDNETWRDKAIQAYGVQVEEMMSMNRMFEKYVIKYSSYPSVDELLIFMYERYIVHGKKSSLSISVEHDTCEIVKDYFNVMFTLTPLEFITRIKKSSCIADRVSIENNLI